MQQHCLHLTPEEVETARKLSPESPHHAYIAFAQNQHARNPFQHSLDTEAETDGENAGNHAAVGHSEAVSQHGDAAADVPLVVPVSAAPDWSLTSWSDLDMTTDPSVSSEWFRGGSVCSPLYKVHVTNLHPEMSPRELRFAFRRCGRVVGGEIFRERHLALQQADEMHKKKSRKYEKGDIAFTTTAVRKAGSAVALSAGNSTYSSVYAFVYLDSFAALQRALHAPVQLFGLLAKHHSMRTSAPERFTRLYVGGLPLRNITPAELRAALLAQLEAVLPAGASSLKTISNANSLKAGFVHIQFDSHEAACQAWRALYGVRIAKRIVRVGWAPHAPVKFTLPDAIDPYPITIHQAAALRTKIQHEHAASPANFNFAMTGKQAQQERPTSPAASQSESGVNNLSRSPLIDEEDEDELEVEDNPLQHSAQKQDLQHL